MGRKMSEKTVVDCGWGQVYSSHEECMLYAGVPRIVYQTKLADGIRPQDFIWPNPSFDPEESLILNGRHYRNVRQLARIYRYPPQVLYWVVANPQYLNENVLASLQEHAHFFRSKYRSEQIPFLNLPLDDDSNERRLKK
jgi:hypothetical protein